MIFLMTMLDYTGKTASINFFLVVSKPKSTWYCPCSSGLKEEKYENTSMLRRLNDSGSWVIITNNPRMGKGEFFFWGQRQNVV